jgi:hypothetical protein
VVEQASFIKTLSLCELDWSCDLLRACNKTVET